MVERNQEWEKEQKCVNRVILEVEEQADQLCQIDCIFKMDDENRKGFFAFRFFTCK